MKIQIWNKCASLSLLPYVFKCKIKHWIGLVFKLFLLFIGISSYHSVYGWKTLGSQKRPSWLKEQRKWWKLRSHYYCFCRQHFREGLRHAHTAASSSKYSRLLVKFHPWLMNKVMTHKQCIETRSRTIPTHWNSSPLCLNSISEEYCFFTL